MKRAEANLSHKEAEAIVRSAIDSGEWSIPLPCDSCRSSDERATIAPIAHGFEVACRSEECGFKMKVPLDWSKLSSSETVAYLTEQVSLASPEAARAWAMSLKYTHPLYFVSQKLERDAAKAEVHSLVDMLLSELGIAIGDAKIMLIGANNCYELNSLPRGWLPENIHAVDPASPALYAAQKQYGKIHIYPRLVESLDDFIDEDGEPLAPNSIDICIAFRSLQSSGLSLWAVLGKIRDKLLAPGGGLLVSMPKQTINFLGNRQPGVFKNKRLDAGWPKAQIEDIARELTQTNGSQYFENVRLYYGTLRSLEYYLLARSSR